MTTRFRNQNRDWNPMRDDYENTSFESQYAVEEAGGEVVEFDHCRLYIRNIPPALNDEGLKSLFSKFGTLLEVFVSTDPIKKFGLVTFETPGDARLAMMKLNRTEPLRLNINIAHKKKYGGNQYQKRGNTQNDRIVAKERGFQRDSSSYSSRGRDVRRLEESTIEDNHLEHLNDSFTEDNMMDLSLVETLDPELNMELECLKLESLRLQEEQLQVKSRILIKQAAQGKSHLANGARVGSKFHERLIVKSTGSANRTAEVVREMEPDYGATAVADDLREPSRVCVVCGIKADTFCGRCGVTPYCGQGCQRRDWSDRHSAVCHNLARLPRGSIVQPDGSTKFEEVVTPSPSGRVFPPMAPMASPLRWPHSLTNQKGSDLNNTDRRKKLSPNNDNDFMNNQNNFKESSKCKPLNRNNKKQANCGNNRKQGNQKPLKQEVDEDDEDWAPSTLKDPKPYSSESIITGVHEPTQKHIPIAKEDNSKSLFKQNTTPKMQVKENTTSPVEEKTHKSKLMPGSLADVMPVSRSQPKLVPNSCLIETMSIGDTCILSVDTPASECRVDGPGFVCLSMNKAYELAYQTLCEDYLLDCEVETEAYIPIPGEPFSYFNKEDSGWYRARCLTPSQAALLDSSKLVPLTDSDKCRKLTDKYSAAPEFCCLLRADVKMGVSLKCTLVSKSSNGYTVSLEDIDTGAKIGEGQISRWLPKVDYPVPSGTTTPTRMAPVIPKVPRPEVANNSRVMLTDATECERVFIRPCDNAAQVRYDSVLFDVLMYGKNAMPLTSPPAKGQVVVAKFTDGHHYRALVTRTNVKQNKYLLEYIEYGNVHIAKLEDLYPCPEKFDLKSCPALASQVTLKVDNRIEFTESALQYIETLKEKELSLTIPSGAKTAANGCEVYLTVVKNNESVNRKLEEMCTPEWKKIEMRGGDVVESRVIMFQELKYISIPPNGGVLRVLNVDPLQEGAVTGTQSQHRQVDYVLDVLPEKLAAYCNSEIGRQPYLPRHEELCIARSLPYPHWYRGVLCQQSGGAGADKASVMFFDYGNLEEVPVSAIRKMLPEFIDGLPAVASHLDIRGFPKNPTAEQLARAFQHMNIDDGGRGTLRVTKCEEQMPGFYTVDAPELLAAIGQ